jgi:hypothetical protein
MLKENPWIISWICGLDEHNPTGKKIQSVQK